MLKFIHRKISGSSSSENPPEKKSFFGRLKQSLQRTRHQLSENISTLFLGKKIIDDELFEEIETILLTADVGVAATQQIIADLTNRVSRNELSDPQALYLALQDELLKILTPCEVNPEINSAQKPYVILMVGVNGAGKTTTIGKLAHYFQAQQKSILLAAGDTFRAAAVEQLKVWGERNQIPVVAQHTGADSASVIFDAIEAGKSRGHDIVIADTAGRLHTQTNLMEELKKVKRVIQKLDTQAPHEILLVLDASIGQNALSQTQLFCDAVGVTGLCLTKLDGTAKGGIIFAIAKQFSLPIRFIGVGEAIDDLREFNAKEFVTALFQN